MDERENAAPLRCRDWELKVKVIRLSAGALGFKGRKIKVKNLRILFFLLHKLQ
jgi:hypothetical protein